MNKNSVCAFCGEQIENLTIWVKLPYSKVFSPSCKNCRNEQVNLRLNLSSDSKEKLHHKIIGWMKDNLDREQKREKEKAKAAKKTAVEKLVRTPEGLELYMEEEKK